MSVKLLKLSHKHLNQGLTNMASGTVLAAAWFGLVYFCDPRSKKVFIFFNGFT